MPNCYYCGKNYKNEGLYFQNHVNKCKKHVIEVYKRYERNIQKDRKDIDNLYVLKPCPLSAYFDQLEHKEIQLIRKYLASLVNLRYIQNRYKRPAELEV